MKNFRNHARKISAVMALSILFVSCSTNEDTAAAGSAQQTAVSKQYSGEDLFRGIFFSEGVVASKLSNYGKFEDVKGQLNAEQKKELLTLQNELISYISKNDPTYFSKFQKSINSGNPVVIRAAIAESKGTLKQAVLKITNVNLTDVEKKINMEKAKGVVDLNKIKDLKTQLGNNPYNSSKEVAVFPVWAVAVVVAVVVAVAVYADVVYWSVIEPVPLDPEDPIIGPRPIDPEPIFVPEDPGLRLEKEQFVNSIIELNAIQ